MLPEIWNIGEYRKEAVPNSKIYTYVFSRTSDSHPISVPPHLSPLCFEALFCRKGYVAVTLPDGSVVSAGCGDVLIADDDFLPLGIQVCAPLSGILVEAGSDSLERSLSGPANSRCTDTGRIRRWFNRRGGCAVISNTAWNRSVFDYLGQLPPDEYGRYCAIKYAELLYLLSVSENCAGTTQKYHDLDADMIRMLENTRRYIEEHLDEPLTISELSRRSFLSSTAFKEYFRRLYGQPVHSWLRDKRMRRAADLLRTSNLNVLGVAQSVGYGSTSQFTAVFRRQYGVTPGKYRKNV